MLTPGSIPRRDYPIFLAALNDDGITYTFRGGSIEWYVAIGSRTYWLRKTQIYNAWDLSGGQFKRFEIWLLHRDNKAAVGV